MSDNSNTSRTNDDPCANCPRADCTGCPSAPALLTTPFFIDGLSIKRNKPKKKKTWVEKQQKRRGWR